MPGPPVVVVGGGIMGAGIAFVARTAGCPVTVVEADPDALGAARDRVEHYERRARDRGGDLDGLGALDVVADLPAAVGAAEVVVEAVPEHLGLKRAVWARIGAAAGDTSLLASNTSGLSIQVLGAASGRPAQVVGLHFFNPVPAMRLVEVVRSPETSAATLDAALAFCARLGKETVEIRDLPGFVTTRLGTLLMCEAVRAFEQGVASAEHIDTAMRLGYNHPLGPLELADRVGLDTLLAILDDLREAFGDAFRAPPLLRQMVAAGHLGMKSGRGFYDHTTRR
ncbi:MAG: 3-hydroxyacyl-CoA dehydrogenase family protein [Acidimicrobiia bacterium]|nr:3-hydroxyacyl-CoA dehydrogenase family protein [Acidimicrobiia bacterium]